MRSMAKLATALLFTLVLLAGCKGPAEKVSAATATPAATTAQTGASAASQLTDPPTVDVGLSVDQAYQAIPHRRTVWREDESSVPEAERAYLKAAFQVLDQAVAVRVAGQQNFSNHNFDSPDIVGEFDRLLDYTRAMPVPPGLASYHRKILDALGGERQYFAEWKLQRDSFLFARQVGNHPGVQKASLALRAAYGELTAKYSQENPANKDAFFDYHCALDFM